MHTAVAVTVGRILQFQVAYRIIAHGHSILPHVNSPEQRPAQADTAIDVPPTRGAVAIGQCALLVDLDLTFWLSDTLINAPPLSHQRSILASAILGLGRPPPSLLSNHNHGQAM